MLSQQVRGLIGEGNQAYVDANYPETIRIMQEVMLNLPYLGLSRSHGHWIAVRYFYLSIPHGLLSSITVLCIPVRSTTLL